MIVRVKHVYKQKNRHGRVYWRHRITGERLDVDQNGRRRTLDQIAARGMEINAGLDDRKATKGFGTLASLITRYQSSPKFAALRASTRREYTRIMGELESEYGDIEVRDIEREDVLNHRDNLADKPRKADSHVAMLSVLFKFALDRPREFGLTANPAQGVEKLHKAGEGHKAWPMAVIETAREKAREKGRLDLLGAIDLALYTGQRCADIAKMQWSDIEGGEIRVVQNKSGRELWIPIHADLRATLDELRRERPTIHNILASSTGKQWTPGWLSKAVAAFMDDIGLGGFTLHGLRKSATVFILELPGMGADDVKAITGHTTDAMVGHYGQKADQRKRARRVMDAWERDGK